MKIRLLVLLSSLALFSCNFDAPINPNALTEPLTVEDTVVGWKIEVPAGWEVSSEIEKQESNQRGLQAIEESIDLEISAVGLRNLLTIKKNETNILAVTAEPFFEEYINEWEVNNEFLREILIDTYTHKGMSAEMSSIVTEEINGVKFITYSIYISKPGDSKVVKQRIYSSLHNGFDVSASFSYTDDELKDEMTAIWKTSQFDIRELPDSIQAHYAEMDRKYAEFIAKGDSAFSLMKNGEAMFWYEEAYNMNPRSEYASDQFDVCNKNADEHSQAVLEMMRNYQKIIDKADELFAAKNYSEARSYYERALGIDPAQIYPKDKIILITDTILRMDYPEDWISG